MHPTRSRPPAPGASRCRHADTLTRVRRTEPEAEYYGRQPQPLPVIEDIHTNTATAKEHVFPPAEAHRLHNSRRVCFDVRQQDVCMEEEMTACSRRCAR